jgi:hypothetical protein
VPDKGDRVQVVVRGKQPKDHGKAQVVSVITMRPYGGDWKADIPGEIEAQIEDLIAGRHSVLAAGLPGTQAGSRPARDTAAALPAIVELLHAAEQSLDDGRCDDYYNKQMSPNFRRVTGKKALQALIASCRNGMGTRQLLLATVHIIQGLEPRYEDESRRAVYDLTSQGLPFQSFSVELVDKRWYIAE